MTEYILYVFSILKFLTRHLVLALVKGKAFVEVNSMVYLVLAHEPLLSLTEKKHSDSREIKQCLASRNREK